MDHAYSRFVTLVTAAVLLVAARPALAAVPSASNSSVDLCVVATFDGSHLLHVVVRDLAGNPVPSSFVVVDLSACTTATFCPIPCTACAYNAAAKTVSALTGGTGAVSFDLRVAGHCPNTTVRVFADGVLLGSRALASPDRDGDGTVTTTDVAAVHALLGSVDMSADFDCSGIVDPADEAFTAFYVHTACDHPVPALTRSWGRLKQLYR